MIKRRNPYLASGLSYFSGLGQLYNGQPVKAVLFVLIDLAAIGLLQLTGSFDRFQGFIAWGFFGITFLIWRVTDGFIYASKASDYELKVYNRWYVYVLFAIGLLAAQWFVIIRELKAFRIASPSMQPTFQLDDRVLANMNYYERNPVRRGDIVVFESPKGGVWLFRVIGLPGDSIEIRDGVVYLNDSLNLMSPTAEYVVDEHEVIEYSEQVSRFKTIKTLRYKEPNFPESTTYAKARVPDDQYFLMGDNRDNTYDSRFLGTIRREAILGRVMVNWWGLFQGAEGDLTQQ